VRTDTAPGGGLVLLMKNLYLAFRANTIDHVIETTPTRRRYFVGYVGWRPGELKSEIDRGLWAVQDADLEMVFRKDTENLWKSCSRLPSGFVQTAAPRPRRFPGSRRRPLATCRAGIAPGRGCLH